MIGILIRRDIGNLSLSLTVCVCVCVCVMGRHSEEEALQVRKRALI